MALIRRNLLKETSPQSRWPERLTTHFNECPQIDLSVMRFPRLAEQSTLVLKAAFRAYRHRSTFAAPAIIAPRSRKKRKFPALLGSGLWEVARLPNQY